MINDDIRYVKRRDDQTYGEEGRSDDRIGYRINGICFQVTVVLVMGGSRK